MYSYGYSYGLRKPSAVSYDADAQAYFDSIADVPVYFKNAVNARILSLKSAGLWTDLKLYLPIPPTNTLTGGIRDARTNTVVGSLANSGGASAAPLYLCLRALNGNQGLTFWGGGHMRTGLIPSTALTLNNSAFSVICQDQDSTSTGYTLGALNSGTQNITFQKRDGSGNSAAQMYNNTVGAGKIQVADNGSSGRYIANRPSNVSFKLYKNGTEVATSSSTGGTLPSNQLIINICTH